MEFYIRPDPHALLQGDKQEWLDLLENANTLIFRYLQGKGWDPDSADDIIQDALIKFAGSLDQIREPEKTWSFLFAIVHRTMLDMGRKNRRSAPNVRFEEVKLTKRKRPVESQVLSRIDLKNGISLLAGLPSSESRIIALSVLGYTDGEIGKAMQDTPLNVRRLRYKGKRALRSLHNQQNSKY